MYSFFKACIYKSVCETVNNLKKTIISLLINILLLVFAFWRTTHNDFLGFTYDAILLIYILIWTIMMSLTLVNDIITLVNKDRLTEQIFLSTCGIKRYIAIVVIYKCIYSTLFVTLIFILSNIISSSFQFYSALSLFSSLLIGSFSIIGIGYIVSCISVIINNKSISLLLRFFLLVIIIRSEANIFIPFSSCKFILTDLLLNKVYLWQQDPQIILSLFLNSLLFFFGGLTAFGMLTSKKLYIKEDF